LIALVLLSILASVSFAVTGEGTRRKFNEVRSKIIDSNWKALPIGSLVSKVGLELLEAPYVGGTLDGTGREVCTVDMLRLDCVTLFEVSLNMARIMQLGKDSLEDLIEAVTYTRYRDGVLSDYTSRLHYTSEWIDNNIKKGVVVDVTSQLGGIPFVLQLGFMSQNPKYYPALVAEPRYVEVMRSIEQRVNTTSRTIIPRQSIANIESQLQDGDIIAIATSKKGLDYSHTGMIVRDGDRARFLHASSTKKKVILDGPISEYVGRLESNLGITVLRPLPVAR
jgi:nitroimidazol reductase NimA-like FMN-containing flavoprotein (pyridoxamine 5'-phosphate oxidase superfamily)